MGVARREGERLPKPTPGNARLPYRRDSYHTRILPEERYHGN